MTTPLANASITSNSGSQTRTLGDRLDDVLNVKDFGVVGNGVTDDTNAIQSAINAAATAFGRTANIIGCVYFPPGNYLIGSSGTGIVLPNLAVETSFWLQGDGEASKITVSAALNGGVAFDRSQSSNTPGGGICIFSGLYILGLMPTPSTLIRVRTNVEFVIEKCGFQYQASNSEAVVNPPVAAIVVGVSSFMTAIRDCEFRGNKVGGIIGVVCGDGLGSGGPQSPSIVNCDFVGWDVGVQSAADGIIDACRFEESNTGLLLGAQLGGGVSGSSACIRDCGFEACFTSIWMRGASQAVYDHVSIKGDTNSSVQYSNTNFSQLSQVGALVTATCAAPLPQQLRNLTIGVISGCANNGSGLIRVTCAVTAPSNPALATGNTVRIDGVTGTVEANGNWIITRISATQFDLQSSTFTNAYISGGTIGTMWFGSGSVFGVNILSASVPGYNGNWLATITDNNIAGSGVYSFTYTAATTGLATINSSGLYNINSAYGIRITTGSNLVIQASGGGGPFTNFICGWDTTSVANQYGWSFVSCLFGTNTLNSSDVGGGVLWQIPTQSTGIQFINCTGNPSTATVFNNLPGQAGANVTPLGAIAAVEGMSFDITDGAKSGGGSLANLGDIVVGSGTQHALVRFNGTNWTVMGL